jgi:hypothetical protein
VISKKINWPALCMFLAVGFLILASSILTGCGEDEADLTDAEKERRQELTFDVSGSYVSDSTSSLLIENEFKFHDIRATFSLVRAFSGSEEQKITQSFKSSLVRMTDEEAATVLAKLHVRLNGLPLSVGATFAERGGENIVLDAEGLQSELVLMSREEVFHEAVFTDSRETYAVEVKTYLTAGKSLGTLTWDVTRNTDKYGQTSDSRKGIYIRVIQRSYDSSNFEQRISTVLDLELITSVFKK